MHSCLNIFKSYILNTVKSVLMNKQSETKNDYLKIRMSAGYERYIPGTAFAFWSIAYIPEYRACSENITCEGGGGIEPVTSGLVA